MEVRRLMRRTSKSYCGSGWMTIAGNIAGKWPAGFCRVAGGKPRLRGSAFAQRQGISLALRLYLRTVHSSNSLVRHRYCRNYQEREWHDSGDGGDGEWQIYQLAAMVGYLNQHADAHILTLEILWNISMPASDV